MLFLIILPTESVILIPSFIQTVGSWVRPCGIGELFIKLDRNSDLDLISHSIFICYIIVRYYSKQLLSLCTNTCDNIMLI